MSASTYRIMSHSVFTATKETALAKRIQYGFKKRIWRKEQKYMLTPDAKAALDELVEGNQRFVGYLASLFSGYGRRRGLSWEDLVGYGEIGLLRAAVKFNPQRGYRFATYAADWIKQGIRQALRRQSLIRIPEKQLQRGIQPIEILEIDEEYEAPNADAQQVEFDKKDEFDFVMRVLDRVCTGRERAILLERMQGVTLQTLGDFYGISRQRVLEIQRKALRNVRYYCHEAS